MQTRSTKYGRSDENALPAWNQKNVSNSLMVSPFKCAILISLLSSIQTMQQHQYLHPSSLSIQRTELTPAIKTWKQAYRRQFCPQTLEIAAWEVYESALGFIITVWIHLLPLRFVLWERIDPLLLFWTHLLLCKLKVFILYVAWRGHAWCQILCFLWVIW